MGYVIYRIINLYQWVLIIRALVSWFPEVQNSQIGLFLYTVTEPVLSPVRQFLRKHVNMSIPIDLSLIVTYFGLEIISLLVMFI